MELILKSNDKSSLAKIITLAKQLNISVEQKDILDVEVDDIDIVKKRWLNFKAPGPSSISDPVEWQREQRNDRDLPFSN